MKHDEFEKQLEACKRPLERFLNYRLPSRADAEDLMGQVYLTAFQNFDRLRDHSAFKAWLFRIAANACNDFYRNLARSNEIEWDEIYETIPAQSRFGLSTQTVVREMLDSIAEAEKQILLRYYFQQKSVAEIAAEMQIPAGTVKSRLYKARQSLKDQYKQEEVERIKMSQLPDKLPEYRITKSPELPFEVKWEELMGWFIIPKLGETLEWGFYDYPERTLSMKVKLNAVGKAQVHGIEGVEIEVEEIPVRGAENDPDGYKQRSLVAQLTETHCRILAETHTENGIKKLFTFLDGDDFLPNWGFGEDNIGNETNLKAKGLIFREGDQLSTSEADQVMDVVGRYSLEINGKTYDTLCLVDVETYDESVATEQFIDQAGRTVLWRRFNADDWKVKPGQKTWSERFPQNDRLIIDGKLYVHWYDCITDYIL